MHVLLFEKKCILSYEFFHKNVRRIFSKVKQLLFHEEENKRRKKLSRSVLCQTRGHKVAEDYSLK